MKVKCPVIFEKLRHQVGDSSIGAQFRPVQVQLCHLGIILEELLEACSQPTLSPRYFEIQILDFCVAPFIHLGHFYSFVSGDFSPFVVLYCTYMHPYVHRTCMYVCV